MDVLVTCKYEEDTIKKMKALECPQHFSHYKSNRKAMNRNWMIISVTAHRNTMSVFETPTRVISWCMRTNVLELCSPERSE